MRARRSVAALAGRAAGWLSRRAGRGGGTAVSGLAAAWIDPTFVQECVRQIDGAVAVTGTNGKTTTTAALTALLRADGQRVITNPTGSNLERGLAAALLPHLGWTGQVREARGLRAVFELDEWAFASLAPSMQPRAAVFLNLFRDQLDRYGEVDRTAAVWAAAIDRLDANAVLAANADDPAVVAVARRHRGPQIYFGVDGVEGQSELDAWADVRRCPRCAGRLRWDVVVYAHLGHYACADCGFRRPQPTVAVDAYRPRGLDGATFRLVTPEGAQEITTQLPGLYNAYNLAAAAAGARAAGVDLQAAPHVLAALPPAFGRAETIRAGATTLILLLVKNPTGANQTLRLLRTEPEPLDTLVLLNDGVADGEDVSWIWDVDFELLRPSRLVVGGRRADDMALRVKYAGVQPGVGGVEVRPGIAPALDAALQTAPRRLVVLTTYTAMLDVRGLCSNRGWVAPYWQETP